MQAGGQASLFAEKTLKWAMLNTSGMRASAGEIHGAFAGSFEFDWPQSELSVKYMQSLHVDLYHFAAVGYYFTCFCLFLQPL